MIDNKIPVYIQIMNILLSEISSGKYMPGDKLPSVRELANMYMINQNTSLHCYTELDRLGVIEVKRGLGYFVKNDSKLIEKLNSEVFLKKIKDFVNEAKSYGFSKERLIQKIEEEY